MSTPSSRARTSSSCSSPPCRRRGTRWTHAASLCCPATPWWSTWAAARPSTRPRWSRPSPRGRSRGPRSTSPRRSRCPRSLPCGTPPTSSSPRTPRAAGRSGRTSSSPRTSPPTSPASPCVNRSAAEPQGAAGGSARRRGGAAALDETGGQAHVVGVDLGAGDEPDEQRHGLRAHLLDRLGDGGERRRGGHGLRDVVEADDGQRSEEHTSELQSRGHLVCRLLLEK